MAEFVVYIGLQPSEYENTSYRKLKRIAETYNQKIRRESRKR